MGNEQNLTPSDFGFEKNEIKKEIKVIKEIKKSKSINDELNSKKNYVLECCVIEDEDEEVSKLEEEYYKANTKSTIYSEKEDDNSNKNITVNLYNFYSLLEKHNPENKKS